MCKKGGNESCTVSLMCIIFDLTSELVQLAVLYGELPCVKNQNDSLAGNSWTTKREQAINNVTHNHYDSLYHPINIYISKTNVTSLQKYKEHKQ